MAVKKTTSKEDIKKVANVVKEEAKKASSVIKEESKKVAKKASEDSKVTKEAVKNSAKEATKVVKETAKKAEKSTKAVADTAKKAAKKTAQKLVTKNVYFEFSGKQIDTTSLSDMAEKTYVNAGGKSTAIKSMKIYVKAEDNAAYYVINEKETGKIEL